MKKKRQISLQECYTILQIAQNSTLEDVKKAYRKRAFELHPDLNPNVADANYQFQRLNEAYVALSQILETEEGARKASAKKEQEKQDKQDKAENKAKAEQKPSDKSDNQEQDKKTQEKKQDKKEEKDNNTKSKAEAQRQRTASAAYAKEDVLRDLLHDPFARRVFEDIYSEVSKQAKPSAPPPPPPPPPKPPKQDKQVKQATPPTVEVEISDNNRLSHVANNFSGKVMGWFRQQIDEEQSIKMPASALFAGARIRLQIRRGLSDELSTVEIVLPKDFVAGKPIRLRGLGKKVGKWQGDLYLTIESIQKTN